MQTCRARIPATAATQAASFLRSVALFESRIFFHTSSARSRPRSLTPFWHFCSRCLLTALHGSSNTTTAIRNLGISVRTWFSQLMTSDAVEEDIGDLARRALSEWLGTFLFVMFVGMSRAAGSLQPLVPAFALLCMKYSLGHVSLASLNPANSLGLWLRGVLTGRACLLYAIAELLGGLSGASFASVFVSSEKAVVLSVKASLGIGFLAEFVATFALVLVSLNNTSADNEGNSFYGVSAGLMLGAIVLVFDPISGACVNPAIAMLSLVAPIYGLPVPPTAWVYFVAPTLAGAAAAGVFRLLSPNDHVPIRFLMKGPVDHRSGTAPHSSSALPDLNLNQTYA